MCNGLPCTVPHCMWNVNDDEPTPEEMREFERFQRFYAKVSELRAKKGDTWGGPPYTKEEYEYARQDDNEGTA